MYLKLGLLSSLNRLSEVQVVQSEATISSWYPLENAAPKGGSTCQRLVGMSPFLLRPLSFVYPCFDVSSEASSDCGTFQKEILGWLAKESGKLGCMFRRNSAGSNKITLLYCPVDRNMRNRAGGKRKRNEKESSCTSSFYLFLR